MRRVALRKGEWFFDPDDLLGGGGFGQVFFGRDASGNKVAVKRLNSSARECAHRELRVADEIGFEPLEYVLPVFDSGQDAESEEYFIVMPVAERSLQDDLDTGTIYSEHETAQILLDIVNGLSEVPEIVHRDLKPANVLRHEGRWKLADFGIARFVEESTSRRTLKDFLSPPYAAPEQWTFERATHATDLYALGCIGYALLSGSPPFSGPDFRRQHLEATPPPLLNSDPRLRSLLSLLLRKLPETRPSQERVRAILEQILDNQEKPSGSRELARLAFAGAEAAEREAQGESVEVRTEERWHRRCALAEEAIKNLSELLDQLAKQITDLAPTAVVARRNPLEDFNYFGLVGYAAQRGILAFLAAQFFLRWWLSSTNDEENRAPFLITIEFESLKLEGRYFRGPRGDSFSPDPERRVLARNAFKRSGWDVICGVQLSLRKKWGHWRGASLWYTDLGSSEGYRWYEVSYLRRLSWRSGRPIALPPNKADAVAASATKWFSIEFGPQPIDDECASSFCMRWLQYFNDLIQAPKE